MSNFIFLHYMLLPVLVFLFLAKIYEIKDGKILSSEVIDNGGNGHHAIPELFAKGQLKPNFEAKCVHHGEHHQ